MDYNNEWLFIIDELGSLLMDLLDTELLTYGNEYSRTEMWTYLSSSEHLLWRLFIIIRIMSFQLIVPSLNVNREGNNTALARMKEFLLIWWSFMRSFWFMHSLENAFLVKKISPTSPTFVFFPLSIATMKEFFADWWSFMHTFWFMHSLENAFLVKISPTSLTFFSL